MAKLIIGSSDRDIVLENVIGNKDGDFWIFASSWASSYLPAIIDGLDTGEVYHVCVTSNIGGWNENFWGILLKVEISDAGREGHSIVALVFEKQS